MPGVPVDVPSTHFLEGLPDSVGRGIVQWTSEPLEGGVYCLTILSLKVPLIWCFGRLGCDSCKALKHPQKLRGRQCLCVEKFENLLRHNRGPHIMQEYL